MGNTNLDQLLEHDMSDKKTAKAEPKDEPKAAKAPQRVKMKNTKAQNGIIGAIASPMSADVPAWLAAGWVKAD